MDSLIKGCDQVFVTCSIGSLKPGHEEANKGKIMSKDKIFLSIIVLYPKRL